MRSEKIEALSRTPLLEELAPDEIEALAQQAVEKRFAPGEMLFHEGDACAGIFVLAADG